MYLAIKTNEADATVGIVGEAEYLETWHAHRSLSVTILEKIEQQLRAADVQWDDIKGVIVYSGPGSFTGLRIGITIANTIAYAQSIPIVGVTGDDWIADGKKRIVADPQTIVMPEYGQAPHITQQRK